MYHKNITLVNLFSSNIVELGIWWWTLFLDEFPTKTPERSVVEIDSNRFEEVINNNNNKNNRAKASLTRFTLSLRIQPSLLWLVAARDGCIPWLFYGIQTSDIQILLFLNSCSAACALSAFVFIWHQKTPTLALLMKTDFQLFSPGFKTLIKMKAQLAPKTKRTSFKTRNDVQ